MSSAFSEVSNSLNNWLRGKSSAEQTPQANPTGIGIPIPNTISSGAPVSISASPSTVVAPPPVSISTEVPVTPLNPNSVVSPAVSVGSTAATVVPDATNVQLQNLPPSEISDDLALEHARFRHPHRTIEEEKVNALCGDHGQCWPVWVSSIILFLVCSISVVTTFGTYTGFYAKSFDGNKFLHQGGSWMMAVTFCGLIIGCIVGGLIGKSPATTIALGGSLMVFSLSVLMLGKCGMWLGALGGAGLGATIGILANLGAFYTGIAALSGVLIGLVLGFAPFLRGLKVNQKYFRASLPPEPTSLSHLHEEIRKRRGSSSTQSSHASSVPHSEEAVYYQRHKNTISNRIEKPLDSQSETGGTYSRIKSVDRQRNPFGLRKAFAGLESHDKTKAGPAVFSPRAAQAKSPQLGLDTSDK